MTPTVVALLTDLCFLSEVAEWLPAAMFGLREQEIVKAAIEHYKQCHDLLPDPILQQWNLSRKQLSILEPMSTESRINLIRQTAEAARRYLGRTYILSGAADRWASGGGNEVLEQLTRIMAIGEASGEDWAIYGDHLKEETEPEPPRITTPWNTLTSYLNGGWIVGYLYVLIGPPKIGKSSFLLNAALAAVMSGHDVLYYTMEIKRAEIEKRLDARIAALPIDELAAHDEERRERVLKWLEERKNKIAIQERMRGSSSALALEATLLSLRAHGLAPSITIVDMLTQVEPIQQSENPVVVQERVVTDLRQIGMRHKTAILTAQHTNKEGLQKSLITASDGRWGIGSLMLADMILTLSQTKDESRRNPPEMRLFIAGSRIGGDGKVVRLKFKKEHMAMYEAI
ncbi:MAG: hypothetical protein DRP85_04090 [Candidatus Makaraimicrobium thalassicum]|nr:MAG: hypothetical protein DRP85_04090 [Candidatus Omnitrophota bacterium]